MSEPKRWLAALDDAPDGVRELLSTYSPTTAMPAEVHGRLLAHATQLSALKPLGIGAVLATKPAVSAIAAAIAGATALSMSLPAASSDAIRTPIERGLGPVTQVLSRGSEPARERPDPVEPVVSWEQLAPEEAASPPPKNARKFVAERPGSLAEEVVLVDRARMLLEQDPAAALRICREHEVRFSNGQLRSTREALTMRALRKLGRAGEARRHAESLLDRDPATLHAEEATRLLDESPRDPE
jgi:hypothetical protein